jgi:hypothetical protein
VHLIQNHTREDSFSLCSLFNYGRDFAKTSVLFNAACKLALHGAMAGYSTCKARMGRPSWDRKQILEPRIKSRSLGFVLK